MKAVDIATKNHVPTEQILSICAELGIPCQDGDSEINDKDLFLVEKKIEVTKNEHAKKLLEQKKKNLESAKADKGKKIKLKRKVHVSRGLIDEKAEEAPKEGGKPAGQSDQNKSEKREKPEGKKPRDNKDQRIGKDGGRPQQRGPVKRESHPARDTRDKRGKDKDAAAVPVDGKEASKEFGKDT
ncbi:MAG: hypothetical protein MUC95_06025, partial [Spirochaetes bacterium]|nr:hypothetical protein [Spirochaetota bacterium]